MEITELRDGPALPTAGILLALDLEARGHACAVVGDKLTVSDGSKLTEADRAEVKRWRLHLIEFVGYCRKGVAPR